MNKIDSPKRIAILSANKYSAYTSAVMQLSLNNNVIVDCVIIKQNFSLSHVFKELKKSKSDLIVKILKKVVIQKFITIGFGSRFADGFSEYFNERFSKESTLLRLSKTNDIPVIETDDFHNSDVLNMLGSRAIDLVLFTGGGLIRKSLISIPKLGVLNCHMGILPDYRGMDCTYWALLERNYDKIGYTTHLMDIGVDTGAIIKRYYLKNTMFKTPKSLIKLIEYGMATALVESMLILFSGNVAFEEQNLSDGRQYYTICDELKKNQFYGI